MADTIHEGHRDRLKNEFINGAFNDNTPDYKWLELLLFYSIPQKDTNPLAHELINKYKTLNGVFEAPIEELEKFKGLSKNTAVLLKLIIPLMRKCEIEKSNYLFNALNPDNISDYVLSRYYGLKTEKISIVCINQVGKIIDFSFLSDGDINEVGISTRKVIKYVLDHNASCVIIAHNHPSSFALPSKADIDTTKQLAKILKQVGVRLIDHIIISENDYVSLSQSNEYKHIFE